MRRAAVLAGLLLLIWGLAIQAPGTGRDPVAAQDDEATLAPFPTVGEFPTVNPDAWPTVGEFQTPGPIATANAIATADALATLAPEPTDVPEPGTIRVVPGRGNERVGLAADVAVELILDNSGSMLQPLGDELRIDVAKRVLTDLVEETLPPGTPLALRVLGDVPDRSRSGPVPAAGATSTPPAPTTSPPRSTRRSCRRSKSWTATATWSPRASAAATRSPSRSAPTPLAS
jgi:hypothetical protein